MFNDVIRGWAPPIQFRNNGTTHNMGHYLTNDIYSDWATLVKTILMPHIEKRKLFTKCQVTIKDVERAFGVLKSCFAIIRSPSHYWHMDIMKNIILTCIILYNMIVEDEQNTYNSNVDVNYDHINEGISNIVVSRGTHPDFIAYLQTRCYMHTRGVHQQLQTN